MIFASDNWAGAHPKITAALATHGSGFVTAYGNSDLDKATYEKFNEIFEREVTVFFVGTGTAANSLALTLASKPGGVGFYHREAHAIEDECGAPDTSPAARGSVRSTVRWAASIRPRSSARLRIIQPKSCIRAGRSPSRSRSRPRSAPSTALSTSTRFQRSRARRGCRCTWTVHASPMRSSRSARHRRK